MLQGSDPYQRLARFFELLNDEAFDDGRREARAETRAQYPDTFPLIEQLEQLPDEVMLPAEMGAEERLLCFSASYFTARSTIESSYRYSHAVQLIERAVEALQGLEGDVDERFISAVCGFARLQNAICDIDRGIYNSIALTMAEASAQLGDGVDELLQLRPSLSDQAATLFDDYLAPQLAAYRHYADAIESIAALYQLRWGEGEGLQRAIDEHLPAVEQALRELKKMGANIMATDLAPHLPVLRRFAERQQTQGSGKLCIEEGQLRIAYFAPLHHNLLRPCAGLMAETLAVDGEQGLSLHGLGASSLESEPMSDIWSGLAARDFVDTYSWQLPSLSLPFRDGELGFEVELTYLSMGVFVLNLSAGLSQLSVSGLRHAMSLGTPYALDETISWGESGQYFDFLEDFSGHIFNQLQSELTRHLGGELPTGASALHWDSADNRYISVRLERVVSGEGEQWHELDAQALQQHTAYPAIALPLREVRSAIDDWILRPAPDAAENLSPLRYNENELMVVQRHGAVIALLQQPDWVREQAVESVEVAAAITNLFQVTNTVLGRHIRHLAVEGPQESGEGSRKSLKRLRVHRDEMEAELNNLNRFERDIHWLLDIIQAGSMMTFPDHTKLMRAVFAEMEFERLRQRTHEILAEVKEVHQQTMDEVSRIYDQLKNHMARRMNRILSAAMFLVSIAALKDLFDLFNEAELGFTISSFAQFASVAALILIAIVLMLRGVNPDE